MKRLLEIACFNLESALIAQEAGADRIELCENYMAGGITPSETFIALATEKIRIPLSVMIRPRPGNFVYNEIDLADMKRNILFCRKLRISSVVFGVLNETNQVEKKVCEELIRLARPMSVTFHRAIDLCKHPIEELQILAELKVDRVLSSGGKATAKDGAQQLKQFYLSFRNQLNIVPGGGIRSDNIESLVKVTGCNEFHSAAIVNKEETADASEIKKLKEILNRQ